MFENLGWFNIDFTPVALFLALKALSPVFLYERIYAIDTRWTQLQAKPPFEHNQWFALGLYTNTSTQGPENTAKSNHYRYTSHT